MITDDKGTTIAVGQHVLLPGGDDLIGIVTALDETSARVDFPDGDFVTIEANECRVVLPESL